MTRNHLPDILLDATDCDLPAESMNSADSLMNESPTSATAELAYTDEEYAKLHQIVRATAARAVWHDRALWDKDDVAQDAMVELLSGKQDINNREAWLKRTVAMCVKEKLRSEYRRKEILQDLPMCESRTEDRFARISNDMEKKAAIVAQAVQLPPVEAIYILLKDLSGLPMRDISCFLNNTLGNESCERSHYNRHKKARKKLATRLMAI